MLQNPIYPQVHSFISPFQHGFMKGLPTLSILNAFIQFLHSTVDAEKQVNDIYTDFSKAFDHLDHSILIKKLFAFGFTDNLITTF